MIFKGCLTVPAPSASLVARLEFHRVKAKRVGDSVAAIQRQHREVIVKRKARVVIRGNTIRRYIAMTFELFLTQSTDHSERRSYDVSTELPI